MNKHEYAKQINYINSEIGEVYHQFSSFLGLSDSVSDILYILEVENGSCDQSMLYKRTMISRKTISSALKKMQEQGYIVISPKNGRENTVTLTDSGKELLEKTETKITQAEYAVYAGWSEEDQRLYYKLNRRYCMDLKIQLKKLKGEER